MTERRRLDLSEIDDWTGELSFKDGDVVGTPAPRTPRTSGYPWSRVRDLMHRVFPGAVVDTGHLHLATRSSSYSRFIVPVDVNGEFGNYIISLPNDGADAARARREWRILAQMAQEAALPFRAPHPIALLLDGDAPVLVVSHVLGLGLHEHPIGDPLQTAAAVAASVHRLDIDAPGPATRREVALEAIEALDGAHGPHAPLVHDAIAFARNMLPPASPTRFVHGSLGAHCILSSLDQEDARPGIIEFEHAARGDPAQDIASLTRGVKKPLAAEGGLSRLLDEYARAGGAPIEATDVHVYEALLLASTIREWNAREPLATPPEAQRLVALLKRA